MYVISFANQKGGVGKTTSAVNSASALGALGKKTLLIDLDPQGSSTSSVGIIKNSVKYSSYDVLTGVCSDPTKAIIETKFKNLHVMPSNILLAAAELELATQPERELFLKKSLDKLQAQAHYDYVIIDCPPSLGMLTVNAMTASDGVVIPMQCEFFALEGLSQLMFTISRIKAHYNKDLNVTGILITMYNNRLILSTQVVGELRKHYADKLFETPVSRNVKLSEAPSFGAPVYYHDKRSKGANEYMNIAKELAERI